MRKRLLLTVLIGVLICVAYALAEQRDATLVQVALGPVDDLEKQTSVDLIDLNAKWDEAGLHHLHYKIAPLRGMITLKDALVVNDGKVLYKRSEHKKLDIDLHFHLTPAKFFVDEIFFLPPVTPFTYNAGEIWFIISYTEGGATKTDAVVWSMKTNLVTRKPYQS